MSRIRRAAWFPFVFALLIPSAPAQDDGSNEPSSPLDALPWVEGPATGDLGRWAQIEVGAEDRFLPAAGARKLLEMMQNPTSGNEVGLLGAPDLTWFAVFEFDPSGYVKDDDKEKLDAGDMLDTLRAGNDQANEERERRGWAKLDILGWITPPHYDSETHNLEWATKARSEGQVCVNHNTRLLGRSGVMSVTLVCAPEDLESVLPIYRERLGQFTFKPGQRYTEFKAGDKIAEYGLTALVAGGAGALAAKSGLLGKLWKLLAAGVVAVIGFFKKLFGRGSKATPASAAAARASVAPSAPPPQRLAPPIALNAPPPSDRDAA